jgi:hypothetical protein
MLFMAMSILDNNYNDDYNDNNYDNNDNNGNAMTTVGVVVG